MGALPSYTHLPQETLLSAANRLGSMFIASLERVASHNAIPASLRYGSQLTSEPLYMGGLVIRPARMSLCTYTFR